MKREIRHSKQRSKRGYGRRRTFRAPSVEETAGFCLAEAFRMRARGFTYRDIGTFYGISHTIVRLKIRDHLKRMGETPSVSAAGVAETEQRRNDTATSALPIVTPVKMDVSMDVSTEAPTVSVLPEGVTTNFQDLAKRTSRYDVGGQFKPSTVFLTTLEYLDYGLGSLQPVIGFNEWRPESRALEIFKSPKKFWVIVVADQDEEINRRWLDSIAADNWIRSRCLVHRVERGNPLSVFQSRMGDQQYLARHGETYADEAFERSLHFAELPTHNHTRVLDGLTKTTDPELSFVPPSFPITVSPTIDRAEIWGYDQPNVSETAGGLATGGSSTNYGK